MQKFDLSSGLGTKNLEEVFLPHGIQPIIKADGTTIYTRSLLLDIPCPVDSTYFPFDSQQCSVWIGSSSYSEKQLNFMMTAPPVELSNVLDNSQWYITSTGGNSHSVQYELWPEPYSEIEFTLSLKRRPLYHVIQIVLPMIFLQLLSLATFMVPPEGGQRVSVGLTTFLALSVFSLVLSEYCPESSLSLPLLCKLHKSLSLTGILVIFSST